MALRPGAQGGLWSGGAVRLGSVAGIPIRAHVTFLLVLPLIAWGVARELEAFARAAHVPPDQLHGDPFLWGLGIALALFLSILVHELAHALYAVRAGGRVRDITLILIGGVSRVTELPEGGRREAIMAGVGPITSLLLGGVFYLLYLALSGTSRFELKFAVFQLFYLNVVLGLFNLLPAFPMDGGRILRGLLAQRWGDLRATQAAAAAGKAFAVLFGILGFVSTNVLLMVIAFFVYLGAESENRTVLVKALLGHIRVRDLVTSRPEAVDSLTSVYELGERMLRERRLAYPVVQGGNVIGVVTLEDASRVPLEERARILVADVSRRVAPLDSGDDASKALRALAEVGIVPVVENGSPAGVLTQSDVQRALQLRELETTQHPGRPQGSRFRLFRHVERHA